MLDGIIEKAFGADGGPTSEDIESLVRNDKFSKYLAPVSYNDENKSYINRDGTVGMIWECQPLVFTGQKELRILESLLRPAYPQGTVAQFIIYPSKDIEPFLERYARTKTLDHPLIQATIDEMKETFRKGVNGVSNFHGIPLRDFRLFFTIKAPCDPKNITKSQISDDLISIIEETLNGAGLDPRRLEVGKFVELLRLIINGYGGAHPQAYSPKHPINKQIIFSETTMEFEKKIRIGNRYAHCLTPKMLPQATDAFDTNLLGGGINGVEDDTEQITTPFLWTLNIVFDDVKAAIHNKTTVTMVQRGSGSFSVSLQKRLEEFTWALSKLDTDVFLRIIPTLWIFGDTEEEARNGAARARRLWETRQYVMQEESAAIAKALYIAALPFGLFMTKNNLNQLDRDFIVDSKAAVQMFPVQTDFKGSVNPVVPLIGRKGQVAGFDLFDKRSNNHNFYITAGSGSGKSVFNNFMLFNYFASGAKVRVIDLGYSYQKMCMICGGKYLDFGRDKICINPFHSLAKDDEDRKFDNIATANVIGTMIYSASNQKLSETEWTLVKEAVQWARDRDGGERGIDHVAEYLRTFPTYASERTKEFVGAADRAKEMAFNLGDFMSHGPYGSYFNGKNTFDIQNDNFVVLELERLKPQKELFKVATMQVMNAVTQDLYLSDRSQRRFIVFEEAWGFIGGGGSDSDAASSEIGSQIEEGYRRARKYGGAFGIVTQSPLDLQRYGKVGDVVRSNAAYKMFLESTDYPEAATKQAINYDSFVVDLLNRVRNNKPYYSEIFIDAPYGKAVLRQYLTRLSYEIVTTAPDEVAKFNKRFAEMNGDIFRSVVSLAQESKN